MLVNEFIERVGYRPTADEYDEIEKAYNCFKGDKDAFCKAWRRANPHKAGIIWAQEKEAERREKVFEKVANFIRKSKLTREAIFNMNALEGCNFIDEMVNKCKCKDNAELREMVYSLYNTPSIWGNWKYANKDILTVLRWMV